MANFKGYKRSIQLGFSYDEVKEGVPYVKKQMAMLNASLKSTSAEANISGKSIDKLGTKYDYLSEKIKIQEQSVSEYKKKLEDATNAKGNNTKAIQNNTASLNIAESKLAQTRAELERVNLELAYQTGTIDKNSTEWKDLEAQLILIDEEFKRNSASMKDTTDNIGRLNLEHSNLSDKLDIQKQQVQAYREKLEESTNAEVKSEVAIRENRIELARAETVMAQTQAQLNLVNKELDSQRTILGKSTKDWEELSKKMDTMGNSLSLKVTAPLVAAGGVAFKMAADYEQAIGKMETVFEKNSYAVSKWAENSLENFGLAKSTATEMAADFGALFKGMGINLTKTQEWSTTLTERTMDLANFYDTTVEETQRALNAIVTGQTEPLRRFGINMTQATLQEYALSQGIRTKISEMTEAEKVQLRYNYVIEKTNIAVGTTARESDTATGQMNRLKETSKELGVSFGEILVPKLIPFIETINSILLAFNSLDDKTKDFIINIGMMALSMGPILKIISSMIDGVSGLATALDKGKDALDLVKDSGGILNAITSKTEGFGMVKLIGYALALAAALALVAASLDLIFNQGKGVQGMMDSISGVFGNKTKQINQAQRSMNQAGRIPGYARGTNNHPGGYAIVGEEGPELLNLPPGSKVHTNSETKDLLGGGDTYMLYVSMDEVGEVYQLMETFRKLKQTKRGGKVQYG